MGTPLVKERVRLFIPEAWVLKSAGHRYVFTGALQPKVFALSANVYDSNRLSARFSQLLHRNMYNTKVLYGLRAIDIDRPQKDFAVSVELEIVVGEGKDENEKIG
jgi:hypothetical protein